MKLGQLREYDMRNIFLEKCKCGGETASMGFSIKSNLSISLDQYSKVLYSLILLYAKLSKLSRLSKYIEIKLQTIL